MLLALGILLAIHFQSVLRVIGTGAILAAALFAILAALAGWLLGGKDAAERTVLGLGAGLRNVPAALIVSVQNFRDPQVSVMVIVSTLAGTLVLLPVARALGKITDRGARSVR
jgi:BASS family bile acid:Na+ symporter